MFVPGQQIGGYTLVRKLGKGGFGEVWLAERKSKFVTKKVAVKLPHDNQVNFDSIRQEAELWEKASGHPNVLPIIDADEYDGQIVIVSEYADGGSLADKIKAEGKLSLKQSVEMTIGILNGLEFLHSRQIIHRDIKPQNILLQGDTPRLADFGISRAMNTSTASSTIIGTGAYMAPEAFDGKRTIQTDMWSVGVVLYQLLSGNLPFPQEHPSERIFAILSKHFPSLPDEIPNGLQNIVSKALTKLPENRYQTTTEMRDELQKVLFGISHPTHAPTEVFHIPSEKFPQISAQETSEPEKETVVSPPNIDFLAPPSRIEPELQTQNPTTIETKERFNQINQAEHSTVQKNSPVESPPIVPQIETRQPTEESAKPLSTIAQSFADKTHASRKSNKFSFILPAAVLICSVIIVGGYFFLKSNSGGALSRIMLPPIESSKLIPFRKGDKWGYSDAQKRIYIDPKFSIRAEPFSEDLALVGAEDNSFLYEYIDKSGNFVIKLDFNGLFNAESFSEGLAKVCTESQKCGFIDKAGNWVVPPKYDSANSFSEGLAKVCLKEEGSIDDSCGFIDKSGKEVIPLKYCHVYSFSEGLALVEDKTNASKIKINGMTAYSNKPIFIDKTGKTILQTNISFAASPLSEDLFCSCSVDPKYYDKTGKIVLETDFAGGRIFSEGLAAVYNYERKDNASKYGFIDKTGTLIIPLQYDQVGDFSEGLAMVEINKKTGFIDKMGKIVIPLKYDSNSAFNELKFKNGMVKVKLDDKDFFIGKDGTEYYEP